MKKILPILLCIILLFNITSFVFADELEEETDYIWLNEEIKKTVSTEFKEPVLNSKNACVLDRSSKKIIYGKKENVKVPMASTTKIMTAIVLVENLQNNGLTLDSLVEIDKKAASINGSRLGLKTKDTITIKDLLYGLMLCSRK